MMDAAQRLHCSTSLQTHNLLQIAASMHALDTWVTISVVRHDRLDPATPLTGLFMTVEMVHVKAIINFKGAQVQNMGDEIEATRRSSALGERNIVRSQNTSQPERLHESQPVGWTSEIGKRLRDRKSVV